MIGLYIYDLVRTGDETIYIKRKTVSKKFITEVKADLSIDFTGSDVDRLSKEMLTRSQNRYLCKLKKLSNDADFSKF